MNNTITSGLPASLGTLPTRPTVPSSSETEGGFGDTLKDAITQVNDLSNKFEQVPRGLNFPYSDKLKIVERFRLTDADTMTIETTLIDPEAFKAPYSMGSRTLKRHRNWTIAEYVCEENNRNFTDAQGKAGVTLANPLSAPR